VDLGGIETAFVAEWGSGRPVIGLLGEYDALAGLSQMRQPTPEPEVAGARVTAAATTCSAPRASHRRRRCAGGWKQRTARNGPLLRLPCRGAGEREGLHGCEGDSTTSTRL